MLCFSGSIDEASTFFDYDDITDIYDLIRVEPEKWANKYRNLQNNSRTSADDPSNSKMQKSSPSSSVFTQFATAVMRYA